MSRRESQLQPVIQNTVCGVNQRLRPTELPLHEFPNIEGVFPEFAGLQSRIWGKRLLHKYASAVYGIHQFWTPQGYGGGLYQFDGTLDFGQWLTPSSNFDLTIPDIGWDGGGMTFDEFGQPYGSNFGYGTDNTCVISFLTGGTDHSVCQLPPTPAGTPNDSNGGPAGQGRHCEWEETITDIPLINFVNQQQEAGYSNVTTQIEDRDNCRNPADGQNPPCVNFPPIPVPVGIIPGPIGYAVVPTTGVLFSSKSASTFAVFNFPTNLICTFRVTESQTNNASNTRLVINLGSLVGDESLASVKLLITRTPGGTDEIPLTVSVDNQNLDAVDYLMLGPIIPNINSGYDQSGSVTCDTVRVRQRKRVCN